MRSFVQRFLTLSIIILLGLIGYNLFMDTYGVFWEKYQVPRAEVAQHFVKMRYLFEKHPEYDAFLFGSSRVGNIHVEKINNGMKYYNMTYANGVPKEWLDDIKQLFSVGYIPQQIVVGVDDFSFRMDPRPHAMDFQMLYYQEHNLRSYVAYLLRLPGKHDFADYKNIYDIYGTGCVFHPWVDAAIEDDVQGHIHNEKFLRPTHVDGYRMEECLNEVREIKELCDEYGVELIVFINPIHYVTYLDSGVDDFNMFKKQLANITSYYDFSGKNEITTNNYNYYETSHYRPLVGDLIIDRLFHGASEKVGFGVYVTKDNVDEHIVTLRDEL